MIPLGCATLVSDCPHRIVKSHIDKITNLLPHSLPIPLKIHSFDFDQCQVDALRFASHFSTSTTPNPGSANNIISPHHSRGSGAVPRMAFPIGW